MSARDCRVVQLLVFEDRPAQEAVDEIAGMTVDNAHQIVTRFRRALRRELDT
jgi:DNA-directed RNA polymerase specialized sigma24 family protein